MRVDEGRARDGGICSEGEKWEGGDAQRKGSGTVEVPSGFGLGRCAVEVLGPRRGERFGEVGPIKQAGGRQRLSSVDFNRGCQNFFTSSSVVCSGGTAGRIGRR